MESIIKTIYERFDHPNHFLSEHRQHLENHFMAENALIQSLSEEQKAQFINLWDSLHDEVPYENCESFICGFQLGARIMLEILTPYEAKKLNI
ncbi:MAG: hypothetical protein IJD60_13200 [Clostridia bacterium]|nr:hypothetical protein [Clostridia bacterium]